MAVALPQIFAAALLIAAAVAAFLFRARRSRPLGEAREFAQLRGLKAGAAATRLSWSGEVKALSTRVSIEDTPPDERRWFAVGSRRLTLTVTVANPNAVAFTLRQKGLSDESNFARAAPELVIALDRIKPGPREALRVTSAGEIGFQVDLGVYGSASVEWLQARLADCREVARLLPRARSVRSTSRAMRAADAQAGTQPETAPLEEAAEPTILRDDETDPFAPIG